jgi:hypothetical protein
MYLNFTKLVIVNNAQYIIPEERLSFQHLQINTLLDHTVQALIPDQAHSVVNRSQWIDDLLCSCILLCSRALRCGRSQSAVIERTGMRMSRRTTWLDYQLVSNFCVTHPSFSIAHVNVNVFVLIIPVGIVIDKQLCRPPAIVKSLYALLDRIVLSRHLSIILFDSL